MGSLVDGLMFDPDKWSKLSIDEKRYLVYGLSNHSPNAAEILQLWSRQDLLQIVCAEMGKEREYTSWPKLKLIEHLLRIVSEKKTGECEPRVIEYSPMAEQRASMRQGKAEHLSRIPVSGGNISMSCGDVDNGSGIYCRNSACKASLSRTDEFCRRCSCCLCHKFDDSKDPSLWLTCSSDAPFHGRACNMSCHLECFLKHGASSSAKTLKSAEFDGTFYCVSCGKVNDFLSCWKKQLVVAKDTRRVDILCYRLSLCQKLMAGTTLYRKVSEIVDEAMRKLEADIGPLTGFPMKMGRGIVNRLSSGPQVQRFCGSAVEVLESMMYHTSSHKLAYPILQDCKLVSPNMIRFEDITATSVTVALGPDNQSNSVGYTLWYHKADDEKGAAEPAACTLFPPETRFYITGLAPATEYAFKVVSYDSAGELSSCEAWLTTCGSRNESIDGKGASEMERIQSSATNCSTLSSPSVEDGTCSIPPLSEKRGGDHPDKFVATNSPDGISNHSKGNPALVSNVMMELCSTDQSYSVKVEGSKKTDSRSVMDRGKRDVGLPINPCRNESLEGPKRSRKPRTSIRDLEDGFGMGEEVHLRSFPKKRSGESGDVECTKNDASDQDLKKYVKVIRWLKHEGHLERSFRQKFLTWFTMRATAQEERVVKVFVDTLSDNPALLAEQLIDTFGEVVSCKRTAVVPAGFCMKLWH